MTLKTKTVARGFDLTAPEGRAGAFAAAAAAGDLDRAHEIARAPLPPDVAGGRAPLLGRAAALGARCGGAGTGDRR